MWLMSLFHRAVHVCSCRVVGGSFLCFHVGTHGKKPFSHTVQGYSGHDHSNQEEAGKSMEQHNSARRAWPRSGTRCYSYSVGQNLSSWLQSLQGGLEKPTYSSIQWKRKSWVLVNMTELQKQPDSFCHQTAPLPIKSTSFGVQTEPKALKYIIKWL